MPSPPVGRIGIRRSVARPRRHPRGDRTAGLGVVAGGITRLLADVPLERRTARFHCAIALTPVIRDHVENASPVCYA